eukprot:152699_1
MGVTHTGVCSGFNTCMDFEDQKESTMEARARRQSLEEANMDIETLAQQDFLEVSTSDTKDKDTNDGDDDDATLYATPAELEDTEEPIKDAYDMAATGTGGNKSPALPLQSGLLAISESQSQDIDYDAQDTLVPNPNTATAQLSALRAKYSSRTTILPNKDKARAPQCSDCGGFYHIQSDPHSAYDGVGIVCDICGKNKDENPELLLEDHYYKCESCKNVDICSKCYKDEKK